MASKSSARLAALTVAAVCSAASTVVLTVPAHAGSAPAGSVRIHDIQGSTRLSPYAGRQVTDVAGIVTGVRGYGSSKGFWIQDPRPDADPATSEGVFVFTQQGPRGRRR
ncbi:Endonuclease/exonuclease/phosphatase OS=Streptomyces tendae OX=1932 GN=GUR47_13025 PE=4 SV=1 [Streptomyces tendae]